MLQTEIYTFSFDWFTFLWLYAKKKKTFVSQRALRTFAEPADEL